MSESRAAIRYAKAVLDLAVEKKLAEGVDNDMRAILLALSENQDLAQVLANPVVKGEAKKQALLKIFKSANDISKGLIETLAANKRIGILKEVAVGYTVLYEKHKGGAVATVTTAVPLTADLEKKILAQVEKRIGKNIALNNKVDESILGGFILRIGDVQYDASLANKLNTLKREFTNSL